MEPIIIEIENGGHKITICLEVTEVWGKLPGKMVASAKAATNPNCTPLFKIEISMNLPSRLTTTHNQFYLTDGQKCYVIENFNYEYGWRNYSVDKLPELVNINYQPISDALMTGMILAIENYIEHEGI